MTLIQTHTSKNTSVNKENLPRIYTHINWEKFNGIRVLDYGCGRYTEHIRKLMWRYDIEWYGYDPYWQTDSLNKEALHCEPVIVICSNVFNILDNYRDVTRIHDYIRYKLCPISFFYTVFEGDKTRIGKETKKDCWQRNEPLEDYLYSDEVIKCRIATKKGHEGVITSKSII